MSLQVGDRIDAYTWMNGSVSVKIDATTTVSDVMIALWDKEGISVANQRPVVVLNGLVKKCEQLQPDQRILDIDGDFNKIDIVLQRPTEKKLKHEAIVNQFPLIEQLAKTAIPELADARAKLEAEMENFETAMRVERNKAVRTLFSEAAQQKEAQQKEAQVISGPSAALQAETKRLNALIEAFNKKATAS